MLYQCSDGMSPQLFKVWSFLRKSHSGKAGLWMSNPGCTRTLRAPHVKVFTVRFLSHLNICRSQCVTQFSNSALCADHFQYSLIFVTKFSKKSLPVTFHGKWFNYRKSVSLLLSIMRCFLLAAARTTYISAYISSQKKCSPLISYKCLHP